MISLLGSNFNRECFFLPSCIRRVTFNISMQMTTVSATAKPLKHIRSTVDNLPSLPVQPLEETLKKYIESVKPFVNKKELVETKQLADEFCNNENTGKKLQEMLESRAKNMENWLEDWWLDSAYLEFRKPVIVYSSPGLVWPKKHFKTENERLIFTANLINAALLFNQIIEEKAVPQEMMGQTPLCMKQYNKIFGTCRIPNLPKDELLFQDPKDPSTNIIVIYNNNFFNISAFKEGTRTPLSIQQFYAMLQYITKKGCKRSEFPVGVLTTEHRDNWALSYKELKKDSKNKLILEKYIEKALFVVCLDKPLQVSNEIKYDTKCSKLLLHGFGFNNNAGNRWYDKTIQFIVGAGSDGVGIAYEHSPAEGGPIGVLTNFILDKM